MESNRNKITNASQSHTLSSRICRPTSQNLTKSVSDPTHGRTQSTGTQQSIKIIAEIAVNMNIVVRNKNCSNLKNSTHEIGYYSYTNRYH